jgi:DNA-binding PadR family transcriptional regulator
MTKGHSDWGRPPWAAFFESRGGPGSRGPGFPFPMFGGPRPPKARRGDVRMGILAVLADGPRNGYQIIQEISERSAGAWKPSPGSVYPTLQQLEDEGLVTADRPEGRRLFDLTEDGRAYVHDHADDLAEVWESMADAQDDGHQDMRAMIGQVMGAAAQVAFAGSPQQRDDARQVLVDARRRLYQILADGRDGEDER